MFYFFSPLQLHVCHFPKSILFLRRTKKKKHFLQQTKKQWYNIVKQDEENGENENNM